MKSIDELLDELKVDLLEAQNMIEWFAHSTRYADRVGDLIDKPRRPQVLAIRSSMSEGESLISAWRKHQGLTHMELARLAGIDCGELFRMERTGEIPDAARERLARALGIVRKPPAVR